jgi:hypothetical protein
MMATPGPNEPRRTAQERRQDQTGEALRQRVSPARRQRVAAAERVAAETTALAAAAVATEAATRPVRRALARGQAKLQERTVRLLTRDDERIRLALQQKEPLSAFTGAGQPTALDELLWFLVEELDLVPVFERLVTSATRYDERQDQRVTRRTNYAPLVLNLLGLLSRYLGQGTSPELSTVLLSDPRWMLLLGFNALEVAEGACRRSEALRGQTRDAAGHFVDPDELGPVRTRLEGPRGALSAQTLAAHESALSPERLVDTFNAVLRRLAQRGYFAPQVRGVLDSTGLEVVPSFPDAGVVRKEVKVESKARRPRKLEVSVRGFKVWYLMDVATGLPLAMALAPIETAETVPARALVLQAQENLGPHARLVSLAVDRGFLAGDFLWWLKAEQGIDWYCPAKAAMRLTAEAHERVNAALAALRQGDEDPLATAQRAARRGQPQAGVRFVVREVSADRAPLVLAEVDELFETDFYGPGGSAASRLNSKHWQPTALFATVVLSWPDRHAADRQDEQEHDPDAPTQGPVVLLSPLAEPAFERFDRYDERSLIENRVNREAKQNFALGASLARNVNAFSNAAVWSTLALVFHRSLVLHQDRASEALERRGETLGVLRYRRQVQLLNRDRLIVVIQDHYGLFSCTDFAQLVGLTFR